MGGADRTSASNGEDVSDAVRASAVINICYLWKKEMHILISFLRVSKDASGGVDYRGAAADSFGKGKDEGDEVR